MNAWPQIARCMEAQWKGFGPIIRGLMDDQWKHGGVPGTIGAAGNLMDTIWYVEHKRGPHYRVSNADLLMSVKVDLPPAYLLIDLPGKEDTP